MTLDNGIKSPKFGNVFVTGPAIVEVESWDGCRLGFVSGRNDTYPEGFRFHFDCFPSKIEKRLANLDDSGFENAVFIFSPDNEGRKGWRG